MIKPKVRFDVSRTTGRWPSILSALGVSDKTLSKRNVPCPFCEGSDRFRFTDKDGAGIWICNQCGTGNGFHFVQRWENTNFVGAIHAIEAVLPQTTVAKSEVPKDSRARLNALWKNALPVAEGDPVSAYLAARRLPRLDGLLEIRAASDVTYWHEKQAIGKYHAMVARVRGGDGKPSTLHVTYLTDDGRKADVPSPKKVLSSMAPGSHVRLANDYCGELQLTEGIETGLAVTAMTGLPTWAMISAGGMDRFVCPEGVDRVAIWCDNDLNFTGQKHAYSLANRLSMAGVTASVMVPPSAGLDWADVIYSEKEGSQ